MSNADQELNEKERDIIVSGLCSGRFQFSSHAYDRCGDRTVTRQDVMEVGHNFDTWTFQGNGRHSFIGRDLENVDLEVICVYDGEVVVITVI